MEVNAEILNNPAALRNDPYGKGWLVAVHVPDEENTTRNLVPKGLVREWMRDAAERLACTQTRCVSAQALSYSQRRPWRECTNACTNARTNGAQMH